ncbi:ABC transporter permease [Aurantibacter crassamenti]|uniref:ABC transporter permease n=1 Tax=Aurantibacter crassamenti TaxID=1837375 RepID=UPI00193A9BFE|nr:FtsX-like permease family protein [Aurantibacter crassamenti]MBM1105184.1 ABC transporter permease [Aurantibacter crassamenti]
MNFTYYIAQRYVRSKSSQNAVNIINFITFLVTVIGSAALFIVLSGFSGLKTFSLSFSNSFDPDLKALPATGKFFSIPQDAEKALNNLNGIASYSREIEEKVYLTHKETGDIAIIKGVDDSYVRTTGVDSTMISGKWTIDEKRGVAGVGIMRLLNLTQNQFRNPLVILVPKPGKGSFSQQTSPYNELPMVIGGIYSVEENLDKKYIFTDITTVQRLLEKDSTQVSGINFKLSPTTDVTTAKAELKKIFGDAIILKDRQELNSSLHRMLNTENLATYLIFTLVLIIALFNVVGAIIMMILDKLSNLKTMYNFGATLKELRRIYFIQGMLVTGAGGIIGVLIGTLLIGSQLLFGWVKIGYIDYPVELKLINIAIVLATIFVLGFIAAKLASSRINKKLIAP